MNNAVGRWLKVGVLMFVATALVACAGAAGKPGAPGEPGPAGPPGPTTPTTPTTPTEPTEPTEPPAEQAPTAVGTIADVSVDVGATTTVDVAANFAESEGEALTFSAESSDTAAATVAVSGSMVTVTGVADGTAMITVTATDTDNLTATQTFGVTVGEGDVEPVTGVSSDCETLDVGDTCMVTAPDGNTVKSGDKNLLTVTKKDDGWEVLAIAKGDTTVEVRNSNTNALEGDPIPVHINNQAPTRKGSNPGLQFLAAAEANADEPGFETPTYPKEPLFVNSEDEPLYKIVIDKAAANDFNLDLYFKDDDGDDVTFSAESSHPDRAIVVGYNEVADGTTEVLVDVLYNTGDEVTFTFSATDDDGNDAKTSNEGNLLQLRVELKPVLAWEYSVGQYDDPQFFNFHNPRDVDFRQNDPTNFNTDEDDSREGWHQLVFSGGGATEAGFKFAEDIAETVSGTVDAGVVGAAVTCDDATFAVAVNSSCYEVTSSDPTIVMIGDLDYDEADGLGTHTINYQVLKSGSVTITVTYKAWDDGTPTPELTEGSKDLSLRVNVVPEP